VTLIERYLRTLGLDGPSGLAGLRAIVRAHLTRVPFENVSKLLLYGREGAGRALTLPEFLDGIEQYDLGGTCYSCNPFLAELLAALGYDVDLLGADMSRPDVHTSIRVRLDDVGYHVDVGYAAPFYEPIRLDRLPHAIDWGRYRYVLERTDRSGTFTLSHLENGERLHGYVVHPPARAAGFFLPAVIASYESSATFMRHLRIARFFDGYSVDLHDRRLTISSPDSSTETRIDTMADLRHACDQVLRMPRCPIEEAIGILERVNGADFFADPPSG
jgi:N-hydroxyarylamine O-acetyltransferase